MENKEFDDDMTLKEKAKYYWDVATRYAKTALKNVDDVVFYGGHVNERHLHGKHTAFATGVAIVTTTALCVAAANILDPADTLVLGAFNILPVGYAASNIYEYFKDKKITADEEADRRLREKIEKSKLYRKIQEEQEALRVAREEDNRSEIFNNMQNGGM